MKSGQKGFTVVETLLVLILLAILGFTGYYVYHTKNSSDSTYNGVTKTASSTSAPSSLYTDWSTYNGNSYSFKYPKDWTASEIPAPPSAPSVKAIEVKPANSSSSQGLIFYGPPTATSSTAKEEATKVFTNDGSKIISSDSSSIYGYDTYTAHTTQTAAGTTYSFWNTYIVSKGQLIYCNYPADTDNTSTDKQIVESFRFQ